MRDNCSLRKEEREPWGKSTKDIRLRRESSKKENEVRALGADDLGQSPDNKVLMAGEREKIPEEIALKRED